MVIEKRSRAYKRFYRDRVRFRPPDPPERARVNWLSHARRLLGMFLVHAIIGGK